MPAEDFTFLNMSIILLIVKHRWISIFPYVINFDHYFINFGRCILLSSRQELITRVYINIWGKIDDLNNSKSKYKIDSIFLHVCQVIETAEILHKIFSTAFPIKFNCIFPMRPTDHKPTLIQIMTRHKIDEKPLPASMMTIPLTHIYVTRLEFIM